MKGARAMRSLPRSGSLGLSGRRRWTWSTPAHAGVAKKTAAATTIAMARLLPTGGLSRRLRVRGVELGEARVVAPDVVVVGLEFERALVLGERPGEVAVRLERDREVVVGPRVVGLLGDGLLVAERGLAPQSLLRDVRAEGELSRGLLRVAVGGAGSRDKKKEDGDAGLLQAL